MLHKEFVNYLCKSIKYIAAVLKNFSFCPSHAPSPNSLDGHDFSNVFFIAHDSPPHLNAYGLNTDEEIIYYLCYIFSISN